MFEKHFSNFAGYFYEFSIFKSQISIELVFNLNFIDREDSIGECCHLFFD